ncbi:MAG: hypothetical protein JW801_01765 [Bacteroidales bacterium]|nr:hypothetical protein [Bacteroidales bacterium]
MPHIIEGGKHIYGLSEVRQEYLIRMPLEAYYEYRFHEAKSVVLISGGEDTGGFSIHTIEVLKHSRLSVLLDTLQYDYQEDRFFVAENSINTYQRRIISWVKMDEKALFTLSDELAGELGIGISDRLAVVRGNRNGPAFLRRGPLYDSALSYPELEVF